MFFRLAKRWLVRCTKPRQTALNENFNLPYGSHVKKHDARLLIGRIAFLTCGKSDTRHLIGLHRFANENLLCGFSVCKSQYVYNKYIYYIDTSVLLENTPLVKFVRNHIRDSSGIFSISFSLISSLSLKLYLNSLVYDRNIFGSSSKVFGNPRQSSTIFGNLRKFLENVRPRSCDLRINFGKSSEIFGKWSEIFGKSSITPSSVCLFKHNTFSVFA